MAIKKRASLKESRKIALEEGEKFGDYILPNLEKLDRAINGSVGRGGSMAGGVGKEATPEAIIAEYDKLGGLILTKEGEKVANGSFYDFKEKKSKQTPLVRVVDESVHGLRVNEEQSDGSEALTPRKKKKRKIEEE